MSKHPFSIYLIALATLVSLAACNSIANNSEAPIRQRGETFKRLSKNEDFSIIYIRTDEVSDSLQVQPDLIKKRAVPLNKEEIEVVIKCLEILAENNEVLPYAPCTWNWDMEYWVTSKDNLAFSIGPKGESILGLTAPFFWFRAHEKLTNAMKSAKKKAEENPSAP